MAAFDLRPDETRAGAAEARRRRGRRRPHRRLPAGVALPALMLLSVLFLCFVWPALVPTPPPVGGDVLEAGEPVLSPGHPLGTDLEGNDLWARLLFGGRASLGIALAVNAIGLLAGGTLGSLAGYAGGIVDSAIMRLVDVWLAFPALVLVIALARTLGPGEGHTIAALACFSVPAFARVARAAALRAAARPFVLAAQLCGTSRWRTLATHVAPSILPQLAAYALLGVGAVIVLEGALSFLGFGMRPPQPTWGNMIFAGRQALLTSPALVLLPSLILFVTVLSLNVLGEALRRARNLR